MKKKLKEFAKNKTAVGIACIGVAILFSIINMSFSGKSSSEKTTSVIVSSTEIQAGEKIEEDMISTIKLSGSIPSNIIIDKEDIVGKYTNVNIVANDIFTLEKLSNEAIYGSAYIENLEENERAISVSINSSAIGLSGKLESGDIVSIISNTENENGEVSSEILEELKYVEIISVNDNNGADVQYNSNNNSTIGDTVTFLVNEYQAKLLATLEFDGNIHLVLVYRGNDEYKQSLLEKQDEFFVEKYPENSLNEDNIEETNMSISNEEIEEINE